MKFNITQDLSQCFPGHRLLSPSCDPLMEDLCVDTLSIFSIPAFQIMDLISSDILQEKDAKIVVFGANLLGNIDFSLSPLELDALWHCWAVCSDNT